MSKKSDGSAFKKLKAETQALTRKANARIRALERANLTESPAYKSYKKHGSKKFSIKGIKIYQDLQKEYWRTQRFLNNKTSTVRGTKRYIKNISKAVGLSNIDILSGRDAIELQTKIFEAIDKVEEYYDNIGKHGEALDYRKHFHEVTEISEKYGLDLTEMSDEEFLEYYVNEIDLKAKNTEIRKPGRDEETGVFLF